MVQKWDPKNRKIITYTSETIIDEGGLFPVHRHYFVLFDT